MTLSEHPWMEHDVTKARAQLPNIPFWRANGWSLCDGPYPEPDLTRDTEPPAEATVDFPPEAPTGRKSKTTGSRPANVGG